MSAIHQWYGIFISRGGVPPGPPLPLDEAKRSIADGQLRQDQLAWCRGLADWKPLNEVINYVEKKTSARLPIQGVDFPNKTAAAPLKPVILAPPPVLRNKKPDAPAAVEKPRFTEISSKPPAEPPARAPDPLSEKMAAVIAAGHAVAKTEVVPADEVGVELWTFAKQCTREFRASLEEQLSQNNVVIHEDLQFNFSQEVLLLHLWLISKVLGADRKPVEAMNRKFIHRQSEIAQTYEHHWEQVEYMRAAKETFIQRFREYHRFWNDHMPRAQTMVAGHLLKSIFGAFTACTKPAENLLVSFINSYLTKMPRAIAAFFEETSAAKK